MALRAWYPLNGNVKNYGIGDFELTQTTAPTWAEGLLCNQALNSGSYSWTAERTASILNNMAFSYSCWIYVGEEDTCSMIFGNGNTGTGGDRWFSLFQYPTKNDLHYYWIYKDDGTYWGGGKSGALPTGKWTHVCAVYKPGYARIYVNGIQVGSTSLTYDITSFSKAYTVIHNNANHRLQDIRIYDHCLSVKEVRELSKGLMVHYLLDNPYTTGAANFYSGIRAQGSSLSSTFTKTKLINEGCYRYSLTYTGTGSDYWASMQWPTNSCTLFKPGRKYTWSCKYRIIECSSNTLTMRSAIVGNDWAHGGVVVANTTLAKNVWLQASKTLTLTDGMTIGSKYYYMSQAAMDASTETSKALMSPLVEFYTGSLKTEGTVFTITVDIKDVQLVESDEFTGFVDGAASSQVINDASGHGYDGTISSTPITLVSDTPRNAMASKFITNSHIKLTDPIKATMDEFTIAFWFNTTTVSNTNQCLWNGRTTTGKAVAIFLINNSIRVDDDTQTSVATISANTWYHFAVTWKKAGNKISYLNGTQVSSVASSTLTKSNTLATIGISSTGSSVVDNNKFTGMMSDYRIYATALSADDIKSLYKAPISISDTGIVLPAEFDETAEKASFKKTGMAKATEFSEIYTKLDSQVRIEPDGSAWMRMVHHSDPTTYLFSSTDSFATWVYKDGHRFFHGKICDYTDRWEFMLIQRATATASVYKYRWVQSVNPNTAVFADVAAAEITPNTSSGYTSFSTGGIYKKNDKTFYCMNNGTSTSWWGALGSWTAYQGGIPGWNNIIVKDGGVFDLYIRLDGGANWNWPNNEKVQILKPDNSIVAVGFDETT